MKYKFVKRSNPLQKENERWYAFSQIGGKVTKTLLARDIAHQSALSQDDVEGVIDDLFEIIPHYLLMGKCVMMGKMGTMRIKFSSEGVDEQEEFKADMIKNVRIIFTPSVIMKNRAKRIKYEKQEKPINKRKNSKSKVK